MQIVDICSLERCIRKSGCKLLETNLDEEKLKAISLVIVYKLQCVMTACMKKAYMSVSKIFHTLA